MNAQVNSNNAVWPVPGHNKINESDKSALEGDGHYGANRGDGSRKHTGIDIQGEIGNGVVSMLPGTVVYASNRLDPNGYGNTVIVDHGNGVATVYAHLSGIDVREGQQINAGQRLGALGADGNARSLVESGAGDPHLHFEVIEGFNRNNLNSGTPVDPNKYLSGAQQVGTPGPSSPSTPGTSSGRVLREGDTGDDVRKLQEALNKNGAQLDADGSFGPLTRAAVERYQASKGLTMDGIAGPQTLGSLGIGQQQAPSNPSAPQSPSNGGNATRSSDFGTQLSSPDFRNSSIYLAIGLAEGTIGRDGKPTAAYNGHQDPGNNVLNRGFGSYQVYQHPSGRGAGISAQEADQIQADRLRTEAWPKVEKALNEAGFKPGPMRDLVAANALDAWNQAPDVYTGRNGLMNQERLTELRQKLESGQSSLGAITEWRSRGYYDDNNRLQAPGLGGTIEGVRRDQERRAAAVADGMSLRPTQAASQTAEQPGAKPPAQNAPANPQQSSAPAHDIGADIAQTAKSWVGKSYKPGETERCQDFVNNVLNQTSPGLANKIGTTRQAQDGLESGENLASRFSGKDVGTPIPRDQLRPGDIVMFKNTYGDYPAGTITHVGIYVGDGMMVDRPTASKPVQMRSIDTFGADNVVAYRPHAYGQTQSVGKPEQGAPANNAQSNSMASNGAPSNTASMPMLREGSTGPDVSKLQTELNKRGEKLDVDGQFGPLTRAAVERYQTKNGLSVDGIAGPETLGSLAKTQQQTPAQPTQPTQPTQPNQPSQPGASQSADFGAQLRSGNVKDSSIYLAIGLAEGTINRNGQPNAAYFGHGDPGNGALNRGFGSYQVQQHPKGEALTPAEADRVQADRLAGQWNRIDKALTEAGFKPGPTRDLIAANALDAWNQAPLTFEDRFGLMNKQQLAELKQKIDSGTSPRDAIVGWRAESYRDDSGRLVAPGLGNSMSRVVDDQSRRVDAVAEGLKLRPPVREHDAAQQPATQQQAAQPHVAGATMGAAVANTMATTNAASKWEQQALAIVDKLPPGTVSTENREKAAALIALQVMDDQRLNKLAGAEVLGKGLLAVSDQANVRGTNSTVGMVNLNGLDQMNLNELREQLNKLPDAAKREPQPVAPAQAAPTQAQDPQSIDPKRGPVLIA